METSRTPKQKILLQRKIPLANSRSPSSSSGNSSGERIPPFLLRIHKLGHIDIFEKGPELGLDQIVRRWMKVSSSLLPNQVETIFDDTLNCLAELALLELELPGTFPGIEAMRPFLRPHPVGKLAGLPAGIELQEKVSSGSPRKEPETQVSVKGFWRRIGEASIGRGPDGQPEVGRTWITPHVRWADKPPAPELPYAKEPLMPHVTDPRRKPEPSS